MRSRRDIIALVVLTVSLVALAFIVRAGSGDNDADDPRRSTFSTGPSGARALFLLADELDLRTERRLEAFTVAPAAKVSLAVILAPADALTPREVSTLLDWVRAGGSLLYALGGAPLLADSLKLRRRPLLTDDVPLLDRARWNGESATASDDSLARGAGELGEFRFAFAPRSSQAAAESMRVLGSVRGDPVAITYPLEQGRIIAFSDANAFSNRALRTAGAALVFARVAQLAAAGDGVIEFDEYHQGYRAGGGPWAALRAFLRTRPGFTALQAAVAGLLLVVLAGYRFGAPYPIAPPRRRSPIEHVEALAGAYRRAGARWTARRLLVEGLYRRLGRRPGLHRKDGPPAGLERTVAGRQLLEEWERGADGNLVRLAHAIDNVVLEVKQWR